MKALKRAVAFLLCSTMILALAACGKKESNGSGTSDDGSIKIGFVGYISGVDAYLGQTAKLALEDAVEEINANGGIIGRQVELISYDIGLDPTPETVNLYPARRPSHSKAGSGCTRAGFYNSCYTLVFYLPDKIWTWYSRKCV